MKEKNPITLNMSDLYLIYESSSFFFFFFSPLSPLTYHFLDSEFCVFVGCYWRGE